MASNLQRLVCTIYILSSFMLSRICSVTSAECVEYYTLFEEKTCDSVNATKLKPALMNHSTWNISKYDVLPLNTSLDEHCFIELNCDDVKTVCEEPVYLSTIEIQDITTTESVEEEHSTETSIISTTESVLTSTLGDIETTTELDEAIETTTIYIEDTIEPECRQFFTYVEAKTCNGGNSTIVKPGAAELEMYFNSSISKNILKSDPNCPFVPVEYQFAELICEEVLTECKPLNKSTQPLVGNSTQNSALIAVGTMGAAGVASALTYYGYIKIIEYLQSGTYRLPG